MTEPEKKQKMANDDLLIYLVRKIKSLDSRIERLEQDVQKLIENGAK
nr:MAG TPA: zipper dimerization domain transcription factor-like protein [Caudoviricetes sp.]